MSAILDRYLGDFGQSAFLLDAAAKATLLLVAATLATALLRRSSAAVRHRLWCLTFAALILLPGLSAALPQWRLAVLPQRRSAAPREESSPLARQAERALTTQAIPPLESDFVSQPVPLAGQAGYGVAGQAGYRAPPHSEIQSPPIRPPSPAAVGLVGAVVALAPLLIGLARTLLLRRQSLPINDTNWHALLGDLRQRLALARRVGLYENASALMPMTWGVLRPVVMLPRQARAWTDRLRRIVLLHELAHIKRFDVGFQFLGRVALAVYWFHPLAWYALRRLRIERELACDDCVVLAGERATDYAADLVEIARSYRAIPLVAAVAMAQRSNLEHRLRAMFDRDCSHLPVSARAARALLTAVLLLVTIVAAVRLTPRVSAGDDKPGNALNQDPLIPEDDLITVSGQVVDPEGKPFSGAKVSAVRWYWDPHIPHAPLAETRSDSEGRFTVGFRKSQFNVDLGQVDQWKNTAIVATATGFAPAWVTWKDISANGKPSLKLAVDDMPVTGRVVDLEGHPIAGVQVRTGYMYAADNGTLDAWVEAVRRGEFPPSAARHLGHSLPQVDSLSPQAVTDTDGRFRIDGLGRERLVEVAFSGPTIGYSQARLVTRRTEPFAQRMGGGPLDRSIPVYGADLDLAASPTQPILGVVRDARTGQPLSGVSIESWRFSGGNYVDQRAIRVVTDAAGRYRLAGMPKGKGNQILAVPNDDQPYFMRKLDVPDPQGLEPITVDIELHRGIWVKGRVTDLATREPLSARLYYLPFQSNEFAREFPEFHPPYVDGYQQRYATQPDGTYRLVALPGRAIIGARCVMHSYRHGVGAEVIAGINDRGTFDTYRNPVEPGKTWPNILKEINPPPGIDEIVCDLALDPGATITVDVVDAEGRPLTGFEVEGRSADYEAMSPAAESRVDVINLGPDENRTVVIRHKQLGIGKVARLRTADHPNSKANVTLERYASVVGRLLDRNGDPVVGAEVTAWVQPTEDFGKRLAPVATDRDGRFEYLDVPTGCPYGLQVEARGMSHAEIAGDLRLTPGETKDLGDITIGGQAKADDKPAAQPAVKGSSANDVSSAPSSGPVQLRGSVVGPSGQPLAGATVYVRRAVTAAGDPPLGSATTDAMGRFQISFAWPRSDERIAAKPDLVVVADAEGFAADWKYLPNDKVPGEIALRLPDAKTLHGRVVNSEGKPLAGVELRVQEIARYDRDTMQLLLEDVAQGRTILRMYKDWRYGPLPKQPAHVTTAADGRFQIAGLAPDTVVKVQIRRAGIRETMFDATTAVRNTVRSSTPAAEPYAARAASILYGSELEYVAEPSRRIQGVVRDRASGRPVPGAKVSCSQQTAALGGFLHRIEAETDAAGRYSLDGCGKESRSFFRVDPPADGLAHFPVEFLLEDTPGIEPVVQDVQLVKGIELRGRIVDNETGEPLVAPVHYAPLYLNTYAAPLYKQQASLRCYSRSKTDGSFRIVVAPGPGALAVSRPSVESQDYITIRVSHDDVVRLFEGSTKHRELARSPELMRGFPDSLPTQQDGGFGFLSQTGNARTILISPDGDKTPEPLEVRLVRGRSLRGQVVAPDGQPLTGVTAYLSNPGIASQLLSGADFQVSALASGEKRELSFHHEQRKLGAFLTITTDEPEPLIVRLEPCGTAVGRLLDEQGAPVEGRHVWFYRVGDYYSTELFSVTDAEGRFRIDELIPGQPYEVLRSEPGSRSRLQFSREKRVFSVTSGQTHDLGDLLVKEPG